MSFGATPASSMATSGDIVLGDERSSRTAEQSAVSEGVKEDLRYAHAIA
jgi:hypothetical protein